MLQLTGMKKKIVLILFILLMFCGCADSNPQTDLKKIVVGIDNFEPYSYIDSDGQYAGVDVELARICFNKLGYEPDFVFIEWANKDTLLKDGDIDCIWSCFSMNGREDKYAWAGPYLYSRQVVLVRNSSDIFSIADLANKRVGVQATTKGEELMLHKIDSTIPELKMVNSFSSTDDLFSSLRKNYVDAICGHEALLNKLAVEDGFRLLDESPYLSKLGVAFLKDKDDDFVNSVNETLKEMISDGSVNDIVLKYGFDSDKVIVNE